MELSGKIINEKGKMIVKINIPEKKQTENYQSEINYLLIELVILSHLAYFFLQTWCYLPINL